MPRTRDYEKDPAAIYAQSFATIRAEADLAALPAWLRPMALRMIHACGMVDLVSDLAWSGDAASAATEALKAGAPILCDAEMVKAGIIVQRFPGNAIRCFLGDPRLPDLAAKLGTTRSAAQIELWRDLLPGSLAIIGNAPTALFHLLELIESGGPRPAVLFAFPVGFVGARESKEALIASGIDIPYVTLRGRRGGSAIAASAVNSLADGAE
jgi:precorrin-8X/cobalt-precorrin-8 methylmutase